MERARSTGNANKGLKRKASEIKGNKEVWGVGLVDQVSNLYF